MDEIEMKFIEKNGKVHNVNVSIMENNLPPVWFSESERIAEVLAHLTDTGTPGILNHVYKLIVELCKMFSCDQPSELGALKVMSTELESDDSLEGIADELSRMNESSSSNDSYSLMEGKGHCEGEKTTENGEDLIPKIRIAKPLYIDAGTPLQKLCSKCSAKYGEHAAELDYRISSEVLELYESEEYKSGMFSIEWSQDITNSHELLVKLYKGHGNILLSQLLPLIRESYGSNHFLFKFRYHENYPSKQMAVQILAPESHESFIAIEMRDWRPTMSTKSVILQIANKMVAPTSLRRQRDPRIPETWGFSLFCRTPPTSKFFVDPAIGLLNCIVYSFFNYRGEDVETFLEEMQSARYYKN